MSRHTLTFNSRNFLERIGTQKTTREYQDRQVIYSQGDAADAMFHIQNGSVKLVVASPRGKQAVIAILGPGDVFGEGCLVNRSLRKSTATAIQLSTIACVKKGPLVRLIHQEPAFAKLFISYLLSRMVRVEEDFVDRLFNFSEKRLARILLLLTQFWQGKWRRNGISQNQSGTLGPNGRHHPVAGQSFHEQVQEAGLCRLQWQRRVDGPSRSPQRGPTRPAFKSNPRSFPSAPNGSSPS